MIISYMLMIITFSTIICLVFLSWRVSAKNIITKIVEDSSEEIIYKIERIFQASLARNNANHSLIENKMVDLEDKKKREMFFAGGIKLYDEEVYSFSYGTENGEYYGARRNEKNKIEIMENNADTNGKTRYYATATDLTAGEFIIETEKFDCRTRDWYKIAKEKGKTVVSPIYKHYEMDDLAISIASPIVNRNGALQGVMGTHIPLSNIDNHLKEIVKDKRTAVYIVEKGSGELVANSMGRSNFKTLDKDIIKRVTIEEIDNKSIREAFQANKKNSETNFIIETENDILHIKLAEYKTEGLDWLIITAIPESQFTVEIMRSVHFLIFLAILALIISLLIYWKSSAKILEPINNLINATEKFSRGDFLQRTVVFKNDEIGKLLTAFNKMAEELYILINGLEERVKKRTIDLEKTNLELNAAKLKADNSSQAKSEFLAFMSHDMKTPLTIISAYGQELKDEKIGELNPDQAERVDNILYASNQLTSIVENLLDFSKLEAEGKSSLLLGEVDVSVLAAEVANGMSSIYLRKNLRMITSIADTNLIIADRRMVKCVMQNLLNNAIKCSNYGDKVHFNVASTYEPVEGVLIEVADYGIGIPKNMQELIFNPFFQVNVALQHEQSGSGLGLAVVKKIVEAHCGKITVISDEGRGAKFIVFLPSYPEFDDAVL
ncbi:signal transduction histidine kinase [Desulfosporosinus youngiae DSM 17734]|uniref:histidine kinase n=2 Tax=Desulfosporosinus TaxID=79206 RepID=H5XYW7_9FIRM|nr:signal transduction histidine kinase [Desulfosporosinus youngiae DSM 17734]